MTTNKARWACTLATLLCLPLPALSANTDDYIIRNRHSIPRPHQLNILTLVNHHSIGGAIWYSLPTHHAGLLPRLNDSLHAEAGLITSYGSPLSKHNDFVAFTPFGGVRWDFHLTHDWTLFTTAKLGWKIGIDEDYDGFTLMGTVGAVLRFDPQIALRIESGYGGIAQVGVSFPL